MSVIAFDWGMKFVGYATADEEGIVITPQGFFERQVPKERIWTLSNADRNKIEKLISEYEISFFILGLPLHADGRESEMSRGARSLAAEMQAIFEIEVQLMDERFTASGKDDHAHAAATLLKDYFDQRAKLA